MSFGLQFYFLNAFYFHLNCWTFYIFIAFVNWINSNTCLLFLYCLCIKKIDIFLLSLMLNPVLNIHSPYFVYWTGIINTTVPLFRDLPKGRSNATSRGMIEGCFFHSQRNYRTQCTVLHYSTWRTTLALYFDSRHKDRMKKRILREGKKERKTVDEVSSEEILLEVIVHRPPT